MATIVVETTQQEQEAVIAAIKKIGKVTIPMTTIAKEAHIGQNRVRYVLTDLLDAGKIKREETKAINPHYVRYKYEVIEEEV